MTLNCSVDNLVMSAIIHFEDINNFAIMHRKLSYMHYNNSIHYKKIAIDTGNGQLGIAVYYYIHWCIRSMVC